MSGNKSPRSFNWKQFILWMSALILGALLGALNINALNDFFNFIAGIYTRLFKFAAVPTIALAVTTTLALREAVEALPEDLRRWLNAWRIVKTV